jgi:hypothetical protein
MLAGWKTLGTQSNSLTFNLSEEDIDKPLKRQADEIMSPKQVISWHNFLTRRRRRRLMYMKIHCAKYRVYNEL